MALFAQLASSLRIKRKASDASGRRSRQDFAVSPSPTVFGSSAFSLKDDLDYHCTEAATTAPAGDCPSRSSRLLKTLSRASTSLLTLHKRKSKLDFDDGFALHGSASRDNLQPMHAANDAVLTFTASEYHAAAATAAASGKGTPLFSSKRFKRFSRNKGNGAGSTTASGSGTAASSVFRQPTSKYAASCTTTTLSRSNVPTPDLSLCAAHVEIIQDVTEAFEGDAQKCPTLRDLVPKRQARPQLYGMPTMQQQAEEQIGPSLEDLETQADADTLAATLDSATLSETRFAAQTPESEDQDPFVHDTVAVNSSLLNAAELPGTRPHSEVDWHFRGDSIGTLLPEDSTSAKGDRNSLDVMQQQDLSLRFSTPAEAERLSLISQSPDALAGLEWLRLEESSRRLKMVFNDSRTNLHDAMHFSGAPVMEAPIPVRSQTPLLPVIVLEKHAMLSSVQNSSTQTFASPFAKPVARLPSYLPRATRPSLSIDTKRLSGQQEMQVRSLRRLAVQDVNQSSSSLKRSKEDSPPSSGILPHPASHPAETASLKKKQSVQKPSSPFSASPLRSHKRTQAHLPDSLTTSTRQPKTPESSPLASRIGRLGSIGSGRGMHASADKVLKKIQQRRGIWTRQVGVNPSRRVELAFSAAGSTTTMTTAQPLPDGWRRSKRPMIAVERRGTYYDNGMF